MNSGSRASAPCPSNPPLSCIKSKILKWHSITQKHSHLSKADTYSLCWWYQLSLYGDVVGGSTLLRTKGVKIQTMLGFETSPLQTQPKYPPSFLAISKSPGQNFLGLIQQAWIILLKCLYEDEFLHFGNPEWESKKGWLDTRQFLTEVSVWSFH